MTSSDGKQERIVQTPLFEKSCNDKEEKCLFQAESTFFMSILSASCGGATFASMEISSVSFDELGGISNEDLTCEKNKLTISDSEH